MRPSTRIIKNGYVYYVAPDMQSLGKWCVWSCRNTNYPTTHCVLDGCMFDTNREAQAKLKEIKNKKD